MITHVVLFRPRPNLAPDQRAALADAMRTAIQAIPAIRRATIGKRVTLGVGYEQLMRVDYEYVAILEFDDETGLRAYLDHGAHEALATRFFECIEEMLFYDFDVDEGERSVDRFA